MQEKEINVEEAGKELSGAQGARDPGEERKKRQALLRRPRMRVNMV